MSMTCSMRGLEEAWRAVARGLAMNWLQSRCLKGVYRLGLQPVGSPLVVEPAALNS